MNAAAKSKVFLPKAQIHAFKFSEAEMPGLVLVKKRSLSRRCVAIDPEKEKKQIHSSFQLSSNFEITFVVPSTIY